MRFKYQIVYNLVRLYTINERKTIEKNESGKIKQFRK